MAAQLNSLGLGLHATPPGQVDAQVLHQFLFIPDLCVSFFFWRVTHIVQDHYLTLIKFLCVRGESMKCYAQNEHLVTALAVLLRDSFQRTGQFPNIQAAQQVL